MENEKLTYINSRGERLELGVDSVYHCNISKDVEGIRCACISCNQTLRRNGQDLP